MIKTLLKPLIKIVTSAEFIELLDKNKDGKVSFSEIWNAPKDVKVTILMDIVVKYVPVLYVYFFH